MQAVVLVGGEGTRLRPLTYSRPKALVPVLGRPFIERFLDHLRAHGFDWVILPIAHGREEITAAFDSVRASGIRIEFAAESQPLGSAGAVRNVAPLLEGGTFLVANGDVLSEIDLTVMLALHRRTEAMVTIALTRVDDPSEFGAVEIDSDDRVRRFVEKPSPEDAPSNWVNAGLWLFEPAALDRIPEGRSMVETGLFPDIIAAAERLTGYRSPAYWIDLGTPQRYLQAHRDRMRAVDRVCCAEAVIGSGAEVRAPAILARGATVRDGARLVGPVVLGGGCDIHAGATVADSVLWERVRVEHGARLRGCVVAEDVVIGAGAVVEDAVLGHGSTVAAGARPPRGLSLDPGESFPSNR